MHIVSVGIYSFQWIKIQEKLHFIEKNIIHKCFEVQVWPFFDVLCIFVMSWRHYTYFYHRSAAQLVVSSQ